MITLSYTSKVRMFLKKLSPEALAYLFPGAARQEIENAFGVGEAEEIKRRMQYPHYPHYPDVFGRGIGDDTTTLLQAMTVNQRTEEPDNEYSTDFGNGEVNYLSQAISASCRSGEDTGDSYPELSPKTIALLKTLYQIGQSSGLSLEDLLSNATKKFVKEAKRNGGLRRLHITERGKIILKGIKEKGIEDVEIRLTPLQKSFYILYLRHSEGIEYKKVQDYKDELRSIYTTLADRGDNDDIERRLNEMCDPLDSTRRNNYSNKIYSAFAEVMTDAFATEYSIVGERGGRQARGEARKIPLPRRYVTDEFVSRY